MHISWLGTSAMRIQTKPFAEEITVVIDPYKPVAGVFPRSLTPHLALFTRGNENSITLSGSPFIIETPGEYEVKGVLVTAIASPTPGELYLRIDTEGISLAHLGFAKKELTETVLDVVGDVDILCVPVGGAPGYDVESAVKAVNAIEPRVVIPMGYKSDNDPKAQPVASFLKDMGVSSLQPEKKIILKKKDLPQDETKVMVLEKE